MPRVGWAFLVCLIHTAALGEDPGAADVVRELYARLSGGNVARAGELWTAAARPRFERTYARAAVRCMRVESLDLADAVILSPAAGEGSPSLAGGPSPSSRLRMTYVIDADATIAEWHAGATSERLTRRLSRFHVRRGSDGWRIEEWLQKEQQLAGDIVRAETDADRHALLRDNVDLVGPELGDALAKRAITLVNERRIEHATAVNAIARRIAEDHLDDRLLSRVAGVESVFARQLNPPDLAASLALARESVRLAEVSGDPDTLQHALLRLIRARRSADAAAEIELFPRALELSEHVQDLAAAAQVATMAAWYYDDHLEHRQALALAVRAEQLAEASGDATAQLGARMNLGGTYMYRADYALAEKHYERALALARQANFPATLASVLERLTAARVWMGDAERALPLIDEVLKLGPPVEVAKVLVYRAWSAINRGNVAAADADLARALAVAEPTQKELLIAEIRDALAAARFQQGRHEEVVNLTSYPALKAESLLILGRHAEAEVQARAAIAGSERLRGRIGVDPRQISRFLSVVTPPSNTLVDVLIDCGRAEEALEELERRKSSLLREALAQASPADLSPLTAGERTRLNDIEERLVRLNRDARAYGRSSARDEIKRTRLELSDFWTRMHALHPELQWAGVASSVADDPAAPRTDIVYVSYAVMDRKTIVFAVTQDERGVKTIRTAQIPIAISALRARVRTFAEQIATRDLAFAANARALYDLLLRPIEHELFRKGRRICIIPDDELWRLPFHALKPSAASFVAKKASLFYAPSMSIAHALEMRDASTTRRQHRLLAFGNPAAQGDSRALPEAEAEVRRIARLYPQRHRRVHLNGSADEGMFKADAADYGVVHIAAHAQLDDSPMYSAVLLNDSAAEDGRLEAREIAALRLDARLVVISACETARGDSLLGQGVMGLPWALLATGARSSVISLWSVDSTATSRLMETLHRRLRASGFASVSDALRAAQLSLLEGDEYSHPYYWAPFVAVGGD